MKAIMDQQDHILTLIEKAREGDREAFDELTAKNYDRARPLVLHLLGGAAAMTADDVLQETFLRAYRQIHRFRWQGEDSFLRWLGGIAGNVVQEINKKQKRAPLIGLTRDRAGTGISQSRALRREERFSSLEESLKTLIPEHREVICLARIEGLPLKEVARKMNRSHGAVRQLLWRALQQLKETFGDTESFHLPDRQIGDKGTHGDG